MYTRVHVDLPDSQLVVYDVQTIAINLIGFRAIGKINIDKIKLSLLKLSTYE